MSKKLTRAAKWLATHGPGRKALKECRSFYQLNAHDTATVCREASLLRGNAQCAQNTADSAGAGAS